VRNDAMQSVIERLRSDEAWQVIEHDLWVNEEQIPFDAPLDDGLELSRVCMSMWDGSASADVTASWDWSTLQRVSPSFGWDLVVSQQSTLAMRTLPPFAVYDACRFATALVSESVNEALLTSTVFGLMGMVAWFDIRTSFRIAIRLVLWAAGRRGTNPAELNALLTRPAPFHPGHPLLPLMLQTAFSLGDDSIDPDTFIPVSHDDGGTVLIHPESRSETRRDMPSATVLSAESEMLRYYRRRDAIRQFIETYEGKSDEVDMVSERSRPSTDERQQCAPVAALAHEVLVAGLQSEQVQGAVAESVRANPIPFLIAVGVVMALVVVGSLPGGVHQ